MSFPLTKQAQERLLASTTSGTVDSTLAVANRTAAYREANLTDSQIELQNFTNGAFIYVSCDADAQTGTFELWGYSHKGDAEFLGSWTYIADAQGPGSDGGYWVDAFTESVASGHTVTEINISDGKACLKFDSLGFKHLVALNTVVSAGTHRIYIRPW